MRLNNQLSNWTINSIDFQLKNRNSKKIGQNFYATWFKEPRRTVPLCVWPRLQLYIYDLDGQKSWWERQGERAYRQGRNLTMTMAIHVHVSPINVFLSSWWCNDSSFGYSVTSQHERGQIWIPTGGWSLGMTVLPYRDMAIPASYVHSICSPFSTMWNRHILHVSRMDNRNETKALKIPIGEFRIQQLLEALRRNIDTVTAAKCANGYHFVQTYLPRCKMFK